MKLRPELYARLSKLSAESYIEDVQSGRQSTNKWIKKEIERGVKDRASGRWTLRWDIMDSLFEFCSRLQIPDSQGKISQFILSPYQAWMLVETFLYYEKDGSRRITEIIYFTGRKSGKTMYAAIVAFFILLMQDYAEPESYFAASGAKQAGILLRYCKGVARNSKNVRVRSERQAYQIKYFNEGKSEAVANKTGGELDGLKPLIAVLDECHALPDNALKSAFVRGMGWSRDTLFMSISTAGVNITNDFYRQVQWGKEMLELENFHMDEKTRYFLFTLDDGDLDRDDLTTNADIWVKANPNLGITPPLQSFIDDLNKAWLMESDRAEFIVKNFNVFNDELNIDKLFSMTSYNRNTIKDFNPEDFFGCEIYLGFDYAPLIDITAIGAVVKKDGIYYSWSDMFVAGSRDALFRRGTKVNLAQFPKDIHINTGKPIPSKEAIIDKFKWYKENFHIMGCGYDPAFSGTLMADVEKIGIDIYPVKQYHVAYNEVVLMMENAMAVDEIKFSDNTIQKYCFNNAITYENNQGMRMAGKKLSKINGDAIDPVVAIMTAFNIWIAENVESSVIANYRKQVYGEQ